MRTDTELIRAYAETRDETAFAELMSRHQGLVYGCCVRMLGSAQDAQDAVQSTFIVLAQKAGSLHKEGALNGWLYDVAHKVCLKALRFRERRERRDDAFASAQESEAGAGASEAQIEAVLSGVDRELAGLSSVLREAVVMRYLQGYSEKDAAALAACPLGTMKRRASEGLAKLRDRLARRGIALGVPVLAAALESEAQAAIPEALLSSTMTAVKAYAAGGAATAAVSANVAGLTQGVLNMMFWSSVKTAAVAVAAAVVVAGSGAIVAQEVAGQRKTAEPPAAHPAADTGSSVVRFIRLKHAGPGWDDGLDTASDRNFLERLGLLAGFKVSTNSEAHGIELLGKYPGRFAPDFVYVTGSGGMDVSDGEVKTLQAYLSGGGMLWADCGGPKWDTSFRALMTRVFPDQPLRDIPDDDPLFGVPFKFPNGAPPLWRHGGSRALGIKIQDRWAVFYHPGDMNDAWKTGHSGLSEAAAKSAFELGVNVVSYARETSALAQLWHANALLAEGKRSEAISLARSISVTYPKSDAAGGAHALLERAASKKAPDTGDGVGGGPQATATEVEKKVAAIMEPLSFKDTCVDDALMMIAAKGGITMRTRDIPLEARVTMDLKGKSVLEAIEIVTQLGNLTYAVTAEGVEVSPRQK